MKFTKMEGCGNDYVYVNGFNEPVDDPASVAKKVSDRHFGIGSDGMIIINPSDCADFRMCMYNADGSEGKMCGNGIRCVAKYVYDHGMTDKTTLRIETLSGIKTLKLNIDNGRVSTVRVNMGAPVLKPECIPVISDLEYFIDKPMFAAGREYRITCVSMGNPHAVTYIDNIDELEIEEVGPLFENNKIFPDRINTEFIQVDDDEHIRMRVWERGSGETLACGTGACAAVVSSALNGYTKDKVYVKLIGGELFIEYDRNENTVYMTGPAVTVFEGEI